MLNPIHLHTFLTVIRLGSFADAARNLGYTGSAVSQQISALEREVQLRLFDRHPHHIQPTPAAEFLADRSREALATLSGLEDDIRAMTEGVLGRVRLGSFPTASEHLMPLTIAALSTEQSGIDISLDEGEPDQLLPLLLDRELDMAVMYRYDSVPQPWPKGLRTTKLLSERLVLLLPEDHRLVGRTVELADLAEEVWIATRVGSAGATSLRRICAIAGYEPNIMFRSSDHSAVRGFVRTGLGIALVPAFGAGALDEEGIVRAHVVDVTVRRHILAVRRTSQENPAALSVERALQIAAKSLADRYPANIEYVE
ncbi:LysR family transcriptional regulator [Rhodococcus koreensis]|uniref:LysR family transcriptional regulator n=1 Tax=Rhodococcus koreensis TaxID=99653 RepID=UPI00366E3FD4